MKEEGKGGGSELGSDLDPDPDPGLDPWKILWIRIRQNDANPLDPDLQHCMLYTVEIMVAYENLSQSTVMYIQKIMTKNLHEVLNDKCV